MGGDDHPGPFGNHDRVFKCVEGLPVEVELRNPEQRFPLAVGIDYLILHLFAAQVHVRHVVDQPYILVECISGRHYMVRDASRNLEEMIRYGKSYNSVWRRLFGEDDSKAGAVPLGLIERSTKTRIVHL